MNRQVYEGDSRRCYAKGSHSNCGFGGLKQGLMVKLKLLELKAGAISGVYSHIAQAIKGRKRPSLSVGFLRVTGGRNERAKAREEMPRGEFPGERCNTVLLHRSSRRNGHGFLAHCLI